jgi:nucleoid DNA-binding protein
MFITRKQLKAIIAKRFPLENKVTIFKYIDIFIELLKDRLIRNMPIMIGNFGILTRRKFKPKRIGNISDRDSQVIVSEVAMLRPSSNFLSFFKDSENRKLFYMIIKRKSEQVINEYKHKRKKPII